MPSGQMLATASLDSNIGIWEPEGTGKKPHTYTHQHGESCAHTHGEQHARDSSDAEDEGGGEDFGSEWK